MCTVGSKIIRPLEIIRVKKFIPNIVLWNKSYSLIFILLMTSRKWWKLASKLEKNCIYYRKFWKSFESDYIFLLLDRSLLLMLSTFSVNLFFWIGRFLFIFSSFIAYCFFQTDLFGCYSRQQNYSIIWENSCEKNSYLIEFYEINIC